MPPHLTQGKWARPLGSPPPPPPGQASCFARENLPSCSLSLFLFFKQDLGAETMGLMLFFFSLQAVSPHLGTVGLDSHLSFLPACGGG